MQRPVTRTIGGLALTASAVVLTLSVLLHPTAAHSLNEYRDVAGASSLAAWTMALAGLLWVAGSVVLARQFNGTRSEGWATLGFAGAIFGGVGLFLVGAIESFGFQGLATGALFSHTEEAFTALSYTSFGVGMLGLAAYYAGVALFGVAMIQSDAWPRWLGWSGAFIGTAIVALLAVGAWGRATETLFTTLSMIGLIWVAVAGWTLRELGRAARQEPAERSEVVAGNG